MAREYAWINGNQQNVLFQTDGFRSDAVAERLTLPDGSAVLLCGDDPLRSENLRLQQQLQEAQDANLAKETFLSNMSHDIRTPMNAIVGMTALAKKHIDEKTRVSDALNKIEVASAHLLSLISDVLDMSRINAGKLNLTEDYFSLSDFLHDTLAIVRPQIAQKHHTFRFTTGEIFAESLYGDPLRLRQIYVNIINNAIKYTNDGGSIDVTVSETHDGDRCVLDFCCKDNGIGMTQAFLERIFEPFERVNSSTISKIEGTGLGMSIVKKLVEAMSGTISVESAPQQGTTVRIQIPMQYRTIQVQTAALAGKRILIIEADPEMQEIYRRYLGEFNILHRIVESSSEAIAALTDADFRSQPFSAVIIGKVIDHTGTIFDLGSYLSQSFPQLVLILISQHNWDEIEYRAGRNGIQHFLPLPIFRKTLINGLNNAFEAHGEADRPFSSPDLAGKHILLAEDNLINREIACELIGATNARIDTAENGEEAVKRYLDAPEGYYDLILMDIQMPIMDGYAATRQIRASNRIDAETLPIYAMTANTFAEDIFKARSAGMNGHLAKPIDIQMLMQVLKQIR